MTNRCNVSCSGNAPILIFLVHISNECMFGLVFAGDMATCWYTLNLDISLFLQESYNIRKGIDIWVGITKCLFQVLVERLAGIRCAWQILSVAVWAILICTKMTCSQIQSVYAIWSSWGILLYGQSLYQEIILANVWYKVRKTQDFYSHVFLQDNIWPKCDP